ncbi:MAG: response regulator [Deltaproteobacteria bacterium]|nr:response regulator [Deltaproteobacteria bacterium]
MRPFHFFRRLSETFAAKIFLVIILLILFLSVSFTAFFVHNEWKSLTAVLVRQGEVLAKSLAYTVRLGVFAENPDLLKNPLDGVLQNNEVLQVSVFNSGGKLLAEKRKGGAKTQKTTSLLKFKEKQEALNRLGTSGSIQYNDQHLDTLEVWAPVSAGSGYSDEESLFYSDNLFENREFTVGFVQVVLDKKILNDALRKTLVNSSLIAMIFLAISVVIVFFVVKGITKPLNRLTERVRVMGSGTPLEKVPVETHDEIGKLATAFNLMAESLQSREAEKGNLEQQLRQAHKMEAIGTLAGGVAHDFNNILSAIEGYAHLLRDSIKKKGPIRTYVDQIVAGTERASDLTRRLLAFSRSQVINPGPLDLNRTIHTIRELLERLAGEDVDFQLDTSAEELVVTADQLQMEQVLINLVTNARDAMPHGGILRLTTESVTLVDSPGESHRQLLPGHYAKLVVSDSGTGIDPSTKERIFDPFFTTKEVGKGTGLGLSMTFGIIKQHKGSIEVSSESRQGTSFSIYLPLVDSVIERKKLESILLPAGNRETILLAEDDRFVRMLTKHILTKYGYQVLVAVDGEDAIRKFREHFNTVQLLLLDVIMPKKNGKEVYEDCRRIKPEIKVVFMSGHPYDVITRQGFAAGEISFIAKPLTPGDLLGSVRKVLDGAGNRVPVAAISAGNSMGTGRPDCD